VKVSRHGSPEALVDLSEGLPVDAAVRQHVESCEACSRQVEELRIALALTRESRPPEPDADYWEGFVPRLRARTAGEHRRPAHPRRQRTWLAAAAAVAALVVVAFLVRDVGRTRETGIVASQYTLLPPTAEDEDFQVLVALADLAGSEADWESIGAELTSRLDLSALTPEEQRQLLERLR